MRKIGAHYICLPHLPLQKGGYVEVGNNGLTLHQHSVAEKEIAGLEFHAGILVTADAAKYLSCQSHPCNIEQCLQEYYITNDRFTSFATIGGIDYTKLQTLPTMVINYFK